MTKLASETNARFPDKQNGKSDAPSVSVVIPCYNAERWIESTIRSVLSQQFPNMEIIVVDDGSTDNSSKLVRIQFPSVVLIQQKNKGVAAARNNGIANAKGEWIAFVDADDIWLPGKLEAQLNGLSQNPGARMAYTAWYVWTCSQPDPTPELIKELLDDTSDLIKWAGPSGWIYPELLNDSCISASTVIAHRSLFKEIGIFDENLRTGEDYDLWLRASRVTPIIRISRPLQLYRMHADSITKSAPEINYQALVIKRALVRWGLESPDGRHAQHRDVNRALARTWRDYAWANLIAGNNSRSFYGSLMSIKSEWRQILAWKLLLRTVLQSIDSKGTS